MKVRSITAKEIIPDIDLTEEKSVDENIRHARHVLDSLIRTFGCTGEVNRVCLYEIAQINLCQAWAFRVAR